MQTMGVNPRAETSELESARYRVYFWTGTASDEGEVGRTSMKWSRRRRALANAPTRCTRARLGWARPGPPGQGGIPCPEVADGIARRSFPGAAPLPPSDARPMAGFPQRSGHAARCPNSLAIA